MLLFSVEILRAVVAQQLYCVQQLTSTICDADNPVGDCGLVTTSLYHDGLFYPAQCLLHIGAAGFLEGAELKLG